MATLTKKPGKKPPFNTTFGALKIGEFFRLSDETPAIYLWLKVTETQAFRVQAPDSYNSGPGSRPDNVPVNRVTVTEIVFEQEN